MAKKVLITGGGGFIGTALARNLASKGFDVRLFDVDFARYDQLCQALGNCPQAEKVQGSVLDAGAVRDAVKGCEYVAHLAALIGVGRTEQKRMECLNINISGTVNVLEACVKGNIEKVLFSSSSEIFGEVTGPPVKEDSQKHPVSVYAVTKLAGEEYLRAYQERYGLKYAIVRFFNVYGPGQVAQFVMPRFIKNVLDSKAPIVYGEGSQIRAFCFVEDAVEGAAQALLLEAGDNEAFNIGNDKEPITMQDLAEKVIAVSGKNFKPEFVAMEESDRKPEREIKRRIPCIDKARSLLGYEPSVPLEEGIRRVIDTDYMVDSWPESS